MVTKKSAKRIRAGSKPAKLPVPTWEEPDEISEALRSIRADPDPMGTYARKTAKCARDGDTEAARAILDDYVGAVGQFSERTWHGPNHYAYARFIADAFEAILADTDAALALGIKTSNPGRRKGIVTHNSEAIAAGYQLLVRLGLTNARARSELRTETGADAKTIGNAIKEWEAYAHPQLIDDEILKDAIKPIREKIARIRARNGKL